MDLEGTLQEVIRVGNQWGETTFHSLNLVPIWSQADLELQWNCLYGNGVQLARYCLGGSLESGSSTSRDVSVCIRRRMGHLVGL